MKNLMCAAALISMSCVFAAEDAENSKSNYHGAYVAVGGGLRRVKQSFSPYAVAEDVTINGYQSRIVTLLSCNIGNILIRGIEENGVSDIDGLLTNDNVQEKIHYATGDAFSHKHLKAIASMLCRDDVALDAVPEDDFIGMGEHMHKVGFNNPLVKDEIIDTITVVSDDIVLQGNTNKDICAAGVIACGYNHRLGDVVLGGEVSVNFANNSKVDYGIFKISEIGTSPNLNLKLGYVLHDVLFGVKFGATLCSNRFNAYDKRVTETRVVPVVGVFVQKKVYKNLDIRLDADYRFNKKINVNYSNFRGGISDDKFDYSVNDGVNIFNKVKVVHKASGGWRANLMFVYNIK